MERHQRSRAENGYDAYCALKNLCQAEADFRGNDRHENGLQDFWTGDVAGLYSTIAGAGPMKLIDRALAEADARPLKGLVPKPIPYHGYYFLALDVDESETPPESYRQDTDKKSGKVHHLSKFGFCAYPAGPDTGHEVWIINEGNTAFLRRDIASPPRSWPSDEELRSWAKP
jgi:hypothetical protein